MDTVNNQEVRSSGGRHEVCFGVTFDDEEDAEYEHSIVWTFVPTLSTGPENARFEVMNLIHKRYPKSLRGSVTQTNFSRDDGSEILHSHGWGSSPHPTESVPETVRERFRSLFGDELAEHTFTARDERVDAVELPEIPDDHSASIVDITLRIDGLYTEDIPEEDPRVDVEKEHFTSHMKDAETGEILHTSHVVNHSPSWWFGPVEDGSRLQIRQCYHKTWDDRMTGGFTEENPREEMIESYREDDDTPSMATLPKEIITTLSEWVGESLTLRSVSHDGGELPTYVYECFGCETVFESTPLGGCPHCPNDRLCRYDSQERYDEINEDQDERDREILEELTNAELTTTVETINDC